jgi:nucleoside-diphosphate-sugar epimerase
VHIRDVVRAILTVLREDIGKVRNQVFNVGSDSGNYSKEEIIHLVQRHVPGVEVEYKDLSFGGDMRDIRVSFEKIGRVLGYRTEFSVEEGIQELAQAILSGFLFDPGSGRNRNAQFIVQ